MKSSRQSVLAAVALVAVFAGWGIGGGCSGSDAEELARAVIGPDGGTISAEGISVEIPAGAVPVDTEFVINRVDDSLSVSDFSQAGDTFAIEPADLRLFLPATVTLTGSADGHSVLAEANDKTVAHAGNVAYVEYVGRVALATSGSQTIGLVTPEELGSKPTSPSGDYVDNLHFEFELEGTHRIDLTFTAWDFGGEQTVLNGNGHCGFKIAQLEGGSITTGCATGELTASINAAGSFVSFDVLPLHAPALDAPVSVGVIAADDDLGYNLGYFSFETGNCYLEECSGQGTCVDNGSPQCECDEGYAPPADDPLSCFCVPQCDGRSCGGDSCGGSCGNCDAGSSCDFANGQCVPDGGDGDGDPDPTTGDGDGDPTGDGDGDPTGDGDGDMGTTG